MRRQLPRFSLLTALSLLAVLALLWGCGDPPPLKPQEVIDKAVPAMKSVQSMHFSLQTSKLAQYPAGLFITGAEGDVARPDKLQATANAVLMSIPLEVKVIGVGDQQFMTDPASGRWGTMSGGLDVIAAFDPNKGIVDILAGVHDLQDAGNESIDGTASYRLKASIAPTSLSAIVPDVTATTPLSATLWVGSDDFRLRQVVLNGPLMSGEPDSISRTIKFSKFDAPVAIQTPVIGTAP